MHHRQTIRRAALVSAALCLAACNDHTPKAPTVQAPPGMPATTTQPAATEEQPDLSNLQPLPDLGQSEIYKDAEGSLWQKYPSGLMVQDLKLGFGLVPQYGQTVWIDYVATLSETNREFDRTTKEHPLNFRLGSNTVITGLNLAVSAMKPGGRRRVTIPPALAYGEKGDPNKNIGPNQSLTYEIELINITGSAVKIPDEKNVKRLLDNAMGPVLGPATAPHK